MTDDQSIFDDSDEISRAGSDSFIVLNGVPIGKLPDKLELGERYAAGKLDDDLPEYLRHAGGGVVKYVAGVRQRDSSGKDIGPLGGQIFANVMGRADIAPVIGVDLLDVGEGKPLDLTKSTERVLGLLQYHRPVAVDALQASMEFIKAKVIRENLPDKIAELTKGLTAKLHAEVTSSDEAVDLWARDKVANLTRGAVTTLTGSDHASLDYGKLFAPSPNTLGRLASDAVGKLSTDDRRKIETDTISRLIDKEIAGLTEQQLISMSDERMARAIATQIDILTGVNAKDANGNKKTLTVKEKQAAAGEELLRVRRAWFSSNSEYETFSRTIESLPTARKQVNLLSETMGVIGAKAYLESIGVRVLFAKPQAGSDAIDVWGVFDGVLMLITAEAKGGSSTLGVRTVEASDGAWQVQQSSPPYINSEVANDENLLAILSSSSVAEERELAQLIKEGRAPIAHIVINTKPDGQVLVKRPEWRHIEQEGKPAFPDDHPLMKWVIGVRQRGVQPTDDEVGPGRLDLEQAIFVGKYGGNLSGIYGGRQGRLSILDELRRAWAERQYDLWRSDHLDTDVQRMWSSLNHSGVIQFGYNQLARIKHHLMRAEHAFAQRGGLLGTLDADPRIAEAWRRLIEGRDIALDLELLEHELAELTYLLDHPGATLAEAHEFADRIRPWAAAATGTSHGLLSDDEPLPWEKNSTWNRSGEHSEPWRTGIAGAPENGRARPGTAEPNRAGAAPESGLGEGSQNKPSEQGATRPGLGADTDSPRAGLSPTEAGQAGAAQPGVVGVPGANDVPNSDLGVVPNAPGEGAQSGNTEVPGTTGIVPRNQPGTAGKPRPVIAVPGEEARIGAKPEGKAGSGEPGVGTKPGVGADADSPRVGLAPSEPSRAGTAPHGVVTGPKANEVPKSGLGVEPTPGIEVQPGTGEVPNTRGITPNSQPGVVEKPQPAVVPTEEGKGGVNPGASAGTGEPTVPAPKAQPGAVEVPHQGGIAPGGNPGGVVEYPQSGATVSPDGEGRSSAPQGSVGSRSAQPVEPKTEVGAPQDRTSGKYGIPTAEDVYRAAARARSANVMASTADILATLMMWYEAAENAGVEQPGTSESGKPTYYDDPAKYEGLLPANQLWPEGSADKWMLENKPEDWLRINYPQFYSVDPHGTLPQGLDSRPYSTSEYLDHSTYEPGVGWIGPDGALIAADPNYRYDQGQAVGPDGKRIEPKVASWEVIQLWRERVGLTSGGGQAVQDWSKYISQAQFRPGYGLVGPDGALIDPNYGPDLKPGEKRQQDPNGMPWQWASDGALLEWDKENYHHTGRTAAEIKNGYEQRDVISYFKDLRYVPGVGLVGPNGAVISRNWKPGQIPGWGLEEFGVLNESGGIDTHQELRFLPFIPKTDKDFPVNGSMLPPAEFSEAYQYWLVHGVLPPNLISAYIAETSGPAKDLTRPTKPVVPDGPITPNGHADSNIKPGLGASEVRSSQTGKTEPEWTRSGGRVQPGVSVPSAAQTDKSEPGGERSGRSGSRTAQPGIHNGTGSPGNGQPDGTDGVGKQGTAQPGITKGSGQQNATQPDGANRSGKTGTAQPGVTKGGGQPVDADGTRKGNVQPGVNQPAVTEAEVGHKRTGNRIQPVQKRALGGSAWLSGIADQPSAPWAAENFAPLDVSTQMAIVRSTMDLVASTRLPIGMPAPSTSPQSSHAPTDRRLAVQIVVRDEAGIGHRKRESAKAMAIGARL